MLAEISDKYSDRYFMSKKYLIDKFNIYLLQAGKVEELGAGSAAIAQSYISLILGKIRENFNKVFSKRKRLSEKSLSRIHNRYKENLLFFY